MVAKLWIVNMARFTFLPFIHSLITATYWSLNCMSTSLSLYWNCTCWGQHRPPCCQSQPAVLDKFEHCSFFLKYILLIMLLQFSQFSPLHPLLPCTLHPSSIPPLSSCPWVVHISSLNSVSYAILDLSPSILCLLIMLLIPCTFNPYSSLPPPTENPPCNVNFSDSVPVLVVCLVFVFVVFLSLFFMFICG